MVNCRFDSDFCNFREFKMAAIVNCWMGYGTCLADEERFSTASF